MKLFLDDQHYFDTQEPLDISIPIINSPNNVCAWYLDAPKIEPVSSDEWIGSVENGAPVNFRNISFNPHSHGTHTECLGHITQKVYSVNDSMKQYFFWAELISVTPQKKSNSDDFVVEKNQISIQHNETEAVIIRTLPNTKEKTNKNYSNTNPPYFDAEIVDLLNKENIEHFLVDTPSVDREDDNGELAFHHQFWKVPSENNKTRTITELIFVDNHVPDGQYILELQVAPFENDASPSRPILYQIKKRD